MEWVIAWLDAGWEFLTITDWRQEGMLVETGSSESEAQGRRSERTKGCKRQALPVKSQLTEVLWLAWRRADGKKNL